MNSCLNKISKNNSKEFDSWVEILNRHRDSMFLNKNLSQEDDMKLTFETVGVFSNIADLAIEYRNFKDKFDTSNMYINLYAPQLIIKSLPLLVSPPTTMFSMSSTLIEKCFLILLDKDTCPLNSSEGGL